VAEASGVRRYSVKRMSCGDWERVVDAVAAEEPLEMRARYWFKNAQMSQSLAVAMRTPGHDRELAAGFLVSEGIVRDRDGIAGLYPLGTEPSNEIVAELSRGVDFESWRAARATFISSSCGVCGKRSREAIAPEGVGGGAGMAADRFRVDAELIERLPELLRARQAGFSQTGGLHAAALVNARGEMECVFEDIGRHNALDKLVGHALLGGRLPLRDSILFLSSRSSFELIQKAAMAGAPVLATVGGPSSLAIDAARDCGITLLGFVREKRFNIYSGDWRIHS
jgi:FdhD protein